MRSIWALTLGLLVGLATAPAQEERGPGQSSQEGFGRGAGRGRFPGPGVGFTTLDLNGDGVLDAQEIEAAPASLSKLDKNADGQITSDEIRMAMPEGRTWRAGRRAWRLRGQGAQRHRGRNCQELDGL
jgi:hypothetical protein